MRVSLFRTARWAVMCCLALSPFSAGGMEPWASRQPLEDWCHAVTRGLMGTASHGLCVLAPRVDTYPYDGCGLESWTDENTCVGVRAIAQAPVAGKAKSAEPPHATKMAHSALDCATSTAKGIDSVKRLIAQDVWECDLSAFEISEWSIAPVCSLPCQVDREDQAGLDCGDQYTLAIVAPPREVPTAHTGIVTHLVNDLRHSQGGAMALDLNQRSDGLFDDSPRPLLAPHAPNAKVFATARTSESLAKQARHRWAGCDDDAYAEWDVDCDAAFGHGVATQAATAAARVLARIAVDGAQAMLAASLDAAELGFEVLIWPSRHATAERTDWDILEDADCGVIEL